MLGVDLVEPVPDRAVVVEVETAREGDLGASGNSTSVSLRRFAARKSRLSIIAAVRVRWLTIDPVRGRQDEPVWCS